MTLFPLGQTVATPGALRELEQIDISPASLLDRHGRGDWGDVDREDWQANERAMMENDRILSVYRLTDDVKVFVITEADRSSTTILLSEEY